MSTGTLYDTGNRFRYLNTAGTTVIRTTPTRLMRISINDIDTAGQVDIHNGATVAGDLIASVAASGAEHVRTAEYDVALSGGLTIVLTANPDITVVFQ